MFEKGKFVELSPMGFIPTFFIHSSIAKQFKYPINDQKNSYASMIWVVLYYIRHVKLNISQWHELLQQFLKEIPLKLFAGLIFIIHDANKCRQKVKLSNCYQEAGHLSFTETFRQQHHITLTHKADITAFTRLQLAFITQSFVGET